MTFTLPELNYSYQALEPYIDSQTMHLHHTAHHQAYINKLNEALIQVRTHHTIPYHKLNLNLFKFIFK